MNKKQNMNFLVLATMILVLAGMTLAQDIEINYVQGDQQTTQQTPDNTPDNIYVNKYSSDYLFSIGASDQNPSVCLCSNTEDKIYVTNTAPYEATFTLLTNIPQYASIPYSAFKLAPGKTAEILITLSADCSSKTGTFDYNVLVSNNFGTQFTIERELSVERCQSIETTLYASAAKIRPCGTVNYTVELKNTAPFEEQFTVRPKSSLMFDTAQYDVTLQPGEKTYLNFTFSPSCEIYGEKDVTFLIDSIKNKMNAKLTHTLIIERAYDFSVVSTDKVEMCRDQEYSIPVTIKNLADFSNDFYFTIVNKQDFLQTADAVLTIGSGEEKTFLVIANPVKSTKTNQILDYEIRTNLGDIKYRGKINLITRDCYALNVNILSENNPVLCAGTYTYDVEVENKGLFEERIKLSTDSEYAEISDSKITLSPSEKKTVSLALSLPDEDVKNMPFKVLATIENQSQTWEDSLTVSVKKKHDCTMLYFEKQKLFERYQTPNTTFMIRNTGTLETEYRLRYSGPEFMELDTKQVTLAPGEYAQIMLNLYADDSEVQKKYDFVIKATADNDEEYESEMTLRMADTPLLQKLYAKATSSYCTIATSILLILFVLGALTAIILAWKRVRVPLTAKIVALIIIALIILAVLITQGLPESRYQKIDKTLVNKSNIILHEDKTYEVELGGYIYDPDNDTLSFYVEDVPENITVDIEGSTATLTPDKDWSGTARIRFLARDDYGEEVVTQRINIEVLEVPEFSYVTLYTKNCVYWNALLLMLLIALVFTLRTRREKDLTSRKIHFAGIKKDKGFLYFVDKDGDVSRTPMARSNKPKQKFKKEKIGYTVKKKK